MKEKIRLVQLSHPELGRKLALVQEPALIFLNKFNSVYDLAVKAVTSGKDIGKLIQENVTGNTVPYDIAYDGLKGWKILPSFDCPSNPHSCLVSGTGLTHKNSALNRRKSKAPSSRARDGRFLTEAGDGRQLFLLFRLRCVHSELFLDHPAQEFFGVAVFGVHVRP